jgi:hypothetical protein
VIAAAIVEALEQLDLAYPNVAANEREELESIRHELERGAI